MRRWRLVRASRGCRGGWPRDRHHRAGLNGAQRQSTDRPEPLVPGTEYRLDLDLYLSSWVWTHAIVFVSPWRTRNGRSLADSLFHDDDAAARWPEGSSIALPTVPVHGQSPPPFAQPEPIEKPSDISTTGDYAWPGTWSLERDEATDGAPLLARDLGSTISVGLLYHHEQLVYHVDDAHPADAAAEVTARASRNSPIAC